MSARYEYKLILCLWRLTIHPCYQAIFFILAIVDVVVLAQANHADKDLTNEDEKAFYRDCLILLFSNVAFLIELIIKLVSLEFKKFTATRLNILDIFLCMT